MAGGGDARFVVSHVIHEVAVEHIPYEQREATIARVKFEALQKLNELVRRHELPATCDCDVRQGQPARQIIKLATEIDAKLIVMESHSPGLADFLIGSVAAAVVRHAPCSVYVVRGAA